MKKNYKTDKVVIYTAHKNKIKEMFFQNTAIAIIAEKFWYTVHTIEKYVQSRATKIYTDKYNVIWRRCSICEIYRLEEFYNSNWRTKYLEAQCVICSKIKHKNYYIIQQNLWIPRNKEKRKESREKWKWKHKARKKILKILGILNGNWKRLQVT